MQKRHAHHLNHATYFPKLRFDKENGICLCGKCHSIFHNKYIGNTRKKCTEKDFEMFNKIVKYIKGLFEVKCYQYKDCLVSPIGIALIQEFESFESKPYLCPAGVPTIGYGNTTYNDGKRVTLDDKPISERTAMQMLKYQCEHIYGKAVNEGVTSEVTQNQFDAMVSFCWNLGVGNFGNSTLLKKHNSEDYVGAGEEFLRWNKSNGKVLAGLVRRREAEKKLYDKE